MSDPNATRDGHEDSSDEENVSTDGWGKIELGELAKYQNGNAFSKSEWTDDGYPIIRIQNLTGEQDELNYFEGELDDRYRVENGDLLLSWSATIDVFEWDGPEAALNQHIYRVDTTDQVNEIFYRFKLEQLLPRLESLSHGSTMKHVRKADLVNLEADLPPLEEQRKIASVLYNIDQAIQKTEETLSQLSRVKKGLYQTLFSEGYQEHDQYKQSKYGEVPEGWDISKLSEVSSRIQAGGTPDTDVSKYYGGDIPWVKTGELSQYRVTETEQSITESGLQESTARLFSPGTILIAMYGATTGEVSLLDIEAATNQACCGVVTAKDLRPEFLFHQLNYLSNHLESLSAGSGQQNISKGIIEKFDVLVPSIQEQDSIVSVLNSVDEFIAKNQSAKNQYQHLKQGLMQDLLSGEVRTNDKDIEILDEVLANG